MPAAIALHLAEFRDSPTEEHAEDLLEVPHQAIAVYEVVSDHGIIEAEEGRNVVQALRDVVQVRRLAECRLRVRLFRPCSQNKNSCL